MQQRITNRKFRLNEVSNEKREARIANPHFRGSNKYC